MRYIGLDLALTTDHKALVIDERGQAITAVLRVNTSATVLEQLFRRAREGAPEDEPLVVVMEPTGSGIPGTIVDPGRVGVGRASCQMDESGSQFDEE